MPDTHRLTVYTTEFRWTGEFSISAHRRMSDVFNDTTSNLLVLKNVVPAIWENSSFRELQQIESIALIRENIVAIVPSTDSPSAQQGSSVERVPKQAIRVFIYAPPLLLLGNMHIPRSANWAEAIGTSRTEFFPITRVNTWYLRTGSQLDTNLELVLIHRRRIIGLEPKNYPTNTASSKR